MPPRPKALVVGLGAGGGTSRRCGARICGRTSRACPASSSGPQGLIDMAVDGASLWTRAFLARIALNVTIS